MFVFCHKWYKIGNKWHFYRDRSQESEAAQNDLESARRARAQISDTQELLPVTQKIINQTDRLTNALGKAISGVEAASIVLGIGEPHYILILLQNADEI
jgi:hypothetical protein